jgi:hypothetical protein
MVRVKQRHVSLGMTPWVRWHLSAMAQTGNVCRPRSIGAFLAVAVTLPAPGCQDLPPIVAQGRYVEIATSRNDMICEGTVPYMDDFLGTVIPMLGATAPDRRFVRYEWREAREASDGSPTVNHAYKNGSSTHIDADRLVDEHELVHAAHHQALPATRSFFYEGVAVMLDGAGSHTQTPWSTGASLDSLLEATPLGRENYDMAWFLVSQIVRDHGMDGLRELWHAIPPDASSERARQAYADLFGRPIDALIEPIEHDDGWLEERWSCYFTLCGEPQPWNGASWRAEGPFDCADDPNALGPMGASGTGTVERYHVVELESSARYRFTATGGAGTYLRPCGLQCRPLGTSAIPFFPNESVSRDDLRGGRYRVEILSRFEDLPTDTPSTFELERLD